MSTSTASRVVGFLCAATAGLGSEQRVIGYVSAGEIRVMDPATAAVQLPITAGAAVDGRSESCVPPSLYYKVLCGYRLSHCIWCLRSQILPLMFPWFLILYVPVHPSSDIQMSGFLQSPSVWVEKLLLNYGCFNNCRLKGRDEESMSCCHDANVTPSQGLR